MKSHLFLLAIHRSPEISVYVSATGSEEVEACTAVTNTKCQCRAGFVPRDTSDSSTCKCEPGFGLNNRGTEKDPINMQSAFQG